MLIFGQKIYTSIYGDYLGLANSIRQLGWRKKATAKYLWWLQVHVT